MLTNLWAWFSATSSKLQTSRFTCYKKAKLVILRNHAMGQIPKERLVIWVNATPTHPQHLSSGNLPIWCLKVSHLNFKNCLIRNSWGEWSECSVLFKISLIQTYDFVVFGVQTEKLKLTWHLFALFLCIKMTSAESPFCSKLSFHFRDS